MKKNKILITGVCGFIGFHLTKIHIKRFSSSWNR